MSFRTDFTDPMVMAGEKPIVDSRSLIGMPVVTSASSGEVSKVDIDPERLLEIDRERSQYKLAAGVLGTLAAGFALTAAVMAIKKAREDRAIASMQQYSRQAIVPPPPVYQQPVYQQPPYREPEPAMYTQRDVFYPRRLR